jgi:hypothetical protein
MSRAPCLLLPCPVRYCTLRRAVVIYLSRVRRFISEAEGDVLCSGADVVASEFEGLARSPVAFIIQLAVMDQEPTRPTSIKRAQNVDHNVSHRGDSRC